MTTFTSSLPEGILHRLREASIKLRLPKNKLIERALDIYLDQINRAEYVASYKMAGEDDQVMTIAEEGMAEYLTQIADKDEAR